MRVLGILLLLSVGCRCEEPTEPAPSASPTAPSPPDAVDLQASLATLLADPALELSGPPRPGPSPEVSLVTLRRLGEEEDKALLIDAEGLPLPPGGPALAGARICAMEGVEALSPEDQLRVVEAVGGLPVDWIPPGEVSQEGVEGGGRRLVLQVSPRIATWVKRGGLGLPPGRGGGPLGSSRVSGWLEVELYDDCGLGWAVGVGGQREVLRAASGEEVPEPPPRQALVHVGRARALLGSPFAQPLRPPEPMPGLAAEALGVHRVELLGAPTVHVRSEGEAEALGPALEAAGVSLTALEPAEALAILEALGQLPPSTIAERLSAKSRWDDQGQLVCEVPGALVVQAAGEEGPRRRPPVAAGLPERGRFVMSLGPEGEARWRGELYQEGSWAPPPSPSPGP